MSNENFLRESTPSMDVFKPPTGETWSNGLLCVLPHNNRVITSCQHPRTTFLIHESTQCNGRRKSQANICTRLSVLMMSICRLEHSQARQYTPCQQLSLATLCSCRTFIIITYTHTQTTQLDSISLCVVNLVTVDVSIPFPLLYEQKSDDGFIVIYYSVLFFQLLTAHVALCLRFKTGE